ncbi:permease [Brevibacillus sp. SYP-B805]|uniref:purine/pyrimidine permease n=1 Tax=Brevibacillus sp. SYP-B805 TaxID=1578199 RepID=UPI0013EC910D|nr:purine/pyrimidine permease [Brevibacillus sp. SYP-B805]NGQ95071.1 permease [Brevibacillus sp. SYP-B805]
MGYGLHEKPPWGITLLAALQWVIVTVSGNVAVPLVIGDAYGLSAEETARFMQQTFFFVGLASFLQVWKGHRYPMMEGPAGLWWGIFLILSQIGMSIGTAPGEIGQALQTGMIAAGLLFFALGAGGWIARFQRLFTPTVTGTYMMLLSIALCSNFIKGMLGIGYRQASEVQPGIALFSIGLIALVLVLLRVRQIAGFAVLLGMLVGWAGYALLGWTEPIHPAAGRFVLPQLFFWGPPRFDAGILFTSVMTGFVLLTNLITSMVVVGRAVGDEATAQTCNRGGLFTGVSHLLSGLSGVVGMIPLSLAAAVISTTKMAARLPFMLAMALLMGIALLPDVSRFLAALPLPVAYAAMFVSFTQLLGFGLKDLARLPLDERTITVVGSSLLAGIGVMFIPASAWHHLHPLVSYLFGNGLLLGVLLALFMEHVVFRPRKEPAPSEPLRHH